jgi:hypothetical protein
VLTAALMLTPAATAGLAANDGGGTGGYSQLPACGPIFYGVTLHVQGFNWRCVHAAPDHWIPS